MTTRHDEQLERDDSLEREVLAALDAVSEVSDSSNELANEAAERAEQIRSQRSDGESWQDIVSSGFAPSLFELLNRIIAEFAGTTSRLRRALVHMLVQEGMRHLAIAELFDLSRQRIGAILKQSPRGGTHTNHATEVPTP